MQPPGRHDHHRPVADVGDRRPEQGTLQPPAGDRQPVRGIRWRPAAGQPPQHEAGQVHLPDRGGHRADGVQAGPAGAGGDRVQRVVHRDQLDEQVVAESGEDLGGVRCGARAGRTAAAGPPGPGPDRRLQPAPLPLQPLGRIAGRPRRVPPGHHVAQRGQVGGQLRVVR
jgi:hypothetical protein